MTSTEKYISAVDELQFTKRQLAALRIKYNSIETEHTIVSQNERSLRADLKQIKDENERLKCQVLGLTKQKQRFIADYSRDIETIKAELARKDQQIMHERLKNENENAIGSNLYRKQIQLDTELRMQDDIQRKDSEINSLKAQLQKLNRQISIDKEKYEFQIKQFEKQIRESEEREIAYLKTQANKAYSESYQKVFNSEESMLRKLRRQLNDLRDTIAQKDEQIQKLMNEKNKLYVQKCEQVTKFEKQTVLLHEELRAAKLEYDSKVKQEIMSMKSIINKEKSDKKLIDCTENNQVRKLKHQIEDLEHELNIKDRTNKELRSQNEQNIQQLTRIKKKCKQIEQQSHSEIKKLQTQLFEYKQQIHKLQSLSQILHKSESKQNKISSQTEQINTKYIKNITQNIQSENIQKHSSTNKKYQGNNEDQNGIALNVQLKVEKQKYLETCRKLEAMENKYLKAKKKLEQANNKVLELIRNKMTMAINQPVVPQNTHKTAYKNNKLHIGQNDPQNLANKFKGNEQSQFLSPQHRMHKTDSAPFFKNSKYRQLLTRSGNREFYERSISINKKRRNIVNELRCMNHDYEEQEPQHAKHDHHCHEHNQSDQQREY